MFCENKYTRKNKYTQKMVNSRKFYIRSNNNKTDPFEAGDVVIVYLLP